MELLWRQGGSRAAAVRLAGRVRPVGWRPVWRPWRQAEQQQTPAANTRLRQTATLVFASCEAGLGFQDAPAAVEGSEPAAEATAAMEAASDAMSVVAAAELRARGRHRRGGGAGREGEGGEAASWCGASHLPRRVLAGQTCPADNLDHLGAYALYGGGVASSEEAASQGARGGGGSAAGSGAAAAPLAVPPSCSTTRTGTLATFCFASRWSAAAVRAVGISAAPRRSR